MTSTTDTTQPIPTPPKPHKPFALVLSGGGGRGLCHAGVLRALEHYGYRPDAIVGVSMGAIVGVTYALNPNWYSALVNINTQGLPASPAPNDSLRSRIRALIWRWRMVQDMLVGWGIGARSAARIQTLLRDLTLGRNLEEGRLPVAVVATDLYSGRRVVLERGNAAEAAYASAALTGIFPPLAYGQHLLADGAYVDLAPIDVARTLGAKVVIAVYADQSSDPDQLRNGLQAMMRAVEICHLEHTLLRLDKTDLVLKPHFPRSIGTLDFSQKRGCVAAGVRAVRTSLNELNRLLRAKNQD